MGESEPTADDTRRTCEGEALQSAESSFHCGWEEAMTGQTRPVSELWDDIDAE
jgi:hypothetical protein